MPKKVVTTTTYNDEPMREEPKVIVEKPPVSNDTFNAFKSRFKDSKEAIVRVHRRTPEGRDYCFTDRAENIDGPESLRRYHARQPFCGQPGVYEIDMEIDGEVYRVPEAIRISPQMSEASTPPVHDLHQGNGGMAFPFLSDLAAQVRVSNENITRLLTQERTPMVEMVDCLSKMQTMLASQNPSGLGTPDAILKWIEVGKAIGGGQGEGWTGLARDVVRDIVPAIVPALPGIIQHLKTPPAKEPPAQPGPGPAQRPIQEPAPSVPPQTEPGKEPKEPITEEPEMHQEALLREVFVFLKSKARRNSDPSIYVDFLVDNQDNPIYDQLISRIVAKESQFSQFVAIDPEIGSQPYRQWFEFIFNGVRSVLGVSDSVDIDTTGTGGDLGNAPTDGDIRKRRGK